MVTHGDLSRTEMDSLKELPIKLDFKIEENYDGQAKYFREAIADYLKSWCNENGYDLYSSGLKIYTTVDSRMQQYAEEAARKQMKQVQQNFNNHWDIYRNKVQIGCVRNHGRMKIIRLYRISSKILRSINHSIKHY